MLESPLVYSLSQIVFAPGASRLEKPYLRSVFERPASRILDVGCGPAPTFPVTDSVLVGVDLSPEYVRSYAGAISEDPALIAGSGKSRLGYVASAEQLPFADGTFDAARSRGLLHHLPPAVAGKAVKEMVRCVRPGGWVDILDNVWPRVALLRPLAWLTRKLDRGEWVRTERELLDLVTGSAPGPWTWVRYTYAYNGLEGLLISLQRPEVQV